MATVNKLVQVLSPGLGDALPVSRTIEPSTNHADGNTLQWDIGLQAAIGLMIVVDITAFTAAASVVPTLQGLIWHDGVPGGTIITFPLLTGAAFGTAVAQQVLRVDPRIPPAANLTAQSGLPDKVRLTMTPADNKPVTYSITAYLLD